MGSIVFPALAGAFGSIAPAYRIIEPAIEEAIVPVGSGTVLVKSGTKIAIGTQIVELTQDATFSVVAGENRYLWINSTPISGFVAVAPIESRILPPVFSFELSPIPMFTSSTQNGYTASASTQFSSSYPAWKAYDGNNADIFSWVSANGSPASSITIQSPSPLTLSRVEITNRNSDIYGSPDNFSVQTSTGGAYSISQSYTVGRLLDREEVIAFDFPETTATRFRVQTNTVRLSPEAVSAGVNFVTIGELRWFRQITLTEGTVWIDPVSKKFREIQSGAWAAISPRVFVGEASLSDSLLGFDPAKINSPTVLSETNNKLATLTTGRSVFGIAQVPEDAIYFEVEAVSGFGGSLDAIGVGALNTVSGVGHATDYGIYYKPDGTVTKTDVTTSNTTVIGTYATFTAGDTIGIAVRGNDVWISKNGIWLNNRPPTGAALVILPGRQYELYPYVYGENSSARLHVRTLSNAPEGFASLDLGLTRYEHAAFAITVVSADTDKAIAHALGSEATVWTASLPAGATGGVISQTRSTVTVRSSIAGTVKVTGVRL